MLCAVAHGYVAHRDQDEAVLDERLAAIAAHMRTERDPLRRAALARLRAQALGLECFPRVSGHVTVRYTGGMSDEAAAAFALLVILCTITLVLVLINVFA